MVDRTAVQCLKNPIVSLLSTLLIEVFHKVLWFVPWMVQLNYLRVLATKWSHFVALELKGLL